DLRGRGVMIPAILATGFGDERILAEALRSGVRDFLPKTGEFLDHLPLTVDRVIHDLRRGRELARGSPELQSSLGVPAAVEAAGITYLVWDLGTDSVLCSPQIRETLGIPAHAAQDDPKSLFALIHHDDRARVIRATTAAREARQAFELIFRGN